MESICSEGFQRDEAHIHRTLFKSMNLDADVLSVFDTWQEIKDGRINSSVLASSNPSSQNFIETRLTWDNVRYSVTEGEKKIGILKGVSGEAISGEVIAIMGGSGAGKTTLLNVLAGRVASGELTADIRVNGQPRCNNWHRSIGYVLQDTALYPNLTIRETVIFMATLKLRASMSQGAKIKRADEVIAMLGLAEVANNYIGGEGRRGISGGQRKRVTIALQLVSNPRVIFIDEPTTGLDSLVSLNIIEGLRALADIEKKIIILTIHQPRTSILNLFTKILLLSRGQAVYFGKVDDALRHFERHGFPCPTWLNPANFFLDVITPDYRTIEGEKNGIARLELLLKEWEKVEEQRKKQLEGSESDFGRQTNEPNRRFEKWKSSEYSISHLEEIKCLYQRRWRNTVRDSSGIKGNILSSLVLLIVICAAYFRLPLNEVGAVDRIGMFFYITTGVIYTTAITLVMSFALDREVIVQERYDSAYRVSSFFIATLLASLPVRLTVSFVFSIIAYYVNGLRTDGFQHILVYVTIFLLTIFNSAALGLFIGSFFRSTTMVINVSGLALSVFFSFIGNYANSESISWIFRWIQYISSGYYSYHALAQNELAGLVFNNGVSGNSYLRQYSLCQLNFWSCSLALIVMAFAFIAFGCLALQRTTKPSLRLQ